MSQDLLREFDSFYQPPKPPTATVQQKPTQIHSHSHPHPQSQSQINLLPRPFPRVQHNASYSLGHGHRHSPSATTFDDLLGIMDSGLTSTKSPMKSMSALQHQEKRRPASLHNPGSSLGYNKSSRIDPYSSGLFDDFGIFETSSPAPQLPPPSKFIRNHTHSQSLFDDFGLFSTPAPPKPEPFRNSLPAGAVAASDDDDFGDFVTPNRTPEPQAFWTPPPPRPTSPPPASRYVGGSSVEPFRPVPSRAPEPPAFQFPPRTSTSFPAAPPPASISLKAFELSPKPPPSSPPEQFPPVVILLQTITTFFLLPQDHLLDKLKGLPFPLRQRVLAHPKTKEFLEGVCELGRVAGRIIAGRRRRAWSTANPSPAGKARERGGMRLGAGTNLQAQREDREVKEAMRIWKEGAGRLKAAMGEVVPDLEEEWKGISREGNGKTCKLCKLGKGELVPGLREKTERPKWWNHGWGGHGSCKSFWEKHGKEMQIVRY
ncbi:hypothetical protein BDD12DRAFT_915683 [Trichophaea hybrida]|nr:hypothetical protein BDD12DRAFT_915683 [Trichophaea hybrida]